MKTTLTLLIAALAFAASAAAAGPNVPWSTKDMKAAVHAIGYPKPHIKKLSCKGSGATSSGQFASFRCNATYPRHRHRVFFIEGQGEGGWLCAGKTLAGCKVLRKGFVTMAAVNAEGLPDAADLAARGYMTNRYGGYQAQGFCKQKAALSWSCPFVEATVTLTLTSARGGYVMVAAG